MKNTVYCLSLLMFLLFLGCEEPTSPNDWQTINSLGIVTNNGGAVTYDRKHVYEFIGGSNGTAFTFGFEVWDSVKFKAEYLPLYRETNRTGTVTYYYNCRLLSMTKAN